MKGGKGTTEPHKADALTWTTCIWPLPEPCHRVSQLMPASVTNTAFICLIFDYSYSYYIASFEFYVFGIVSDHLTESIS